MQVSHRQCHARHVELLTRAQRTGEVRRDIGIADLMALLRGTFVAVSQEDGDTGLADRVLAVVCDGLRP